MLGVGHLNSLLGDFMWVKNKTWVCSFLAWSSTHFLTNVPTARMQWHFYQKPLLLTILVHMVLRILGARCPEFNECKNCSLFLWQPCEFSSYPFYRTGNWGSGPGCAEAVELMSAGAKAKARIATKLFVLVKTAQYHEWERHWTGSETSFEGRAVDSCPLWNALCFQLLIAPLASNH